MIKRWLHEDLSTYSAIYYVCSDKAPSADDRQENGRIYVVVHPSRPSFPLLCLATTCFLAPYMQ